MSDPGIFMRTVAIRNASRTDIDQIHLHMIEAFSAESSECWSQQMLNNFRLRPEAIVRIAEETAAGDMVGFFLARQKLDEVELLTLCVALEFRRQGIALRLVQDLLDCSSINGVEQVFLEVRENNVPARQLYRQSGFQETGRRTDYYRNADRSRSDALTMRFKTLQE